MTEFDDDTVALISKRVYDMAGITKGVKVHLNGKLIKIKDFKAYVQMYTNGINHISGSGKTGGAKSDLIGVDPAAAAAAEKKTIIYEKFSERWEVAFAVSEGQFTQVSFCNAIATTKGGTHVEYIAKQIVDGIAELVNKKNAKGAQVKPFQIKNHMSIFVNCLIANPAFDSQTKENMTLGVSKFGSKCQLASSEDFLKKGGFGFSPKLPCFDRFRRLVTEASRSMGADSLLSHHSSLGSRPLSHPHCLCNSVPSCPHLHLPQFSSPVSSTRFCRGPSSSRISFSRRPTDTRGVGGLTVESTENA